MIELALIGDLVMGKAPDIIDPGRFQVFRADSWRCDHALCSRAFMSLMVEENDSGGT